MPYYITDWGGCFCDVEPHYPGCVAKFYFLVVFNVGSDFRVTRWLSKN